MEQNIFIDRLIKVLDKKGLEFLFFEKNQENGKPLIIANWNEIDDRHTDKIEEACDKHDVGFGWIDEWTQCDNCEQAIRTSPTSYDWGPNFIQVGYYESGDGLSFICRDCIEDEMDYEQVEEFIQEYNGDHEYAFPSWMEKFLPQYGFSSYGKNYETGMHPHQTDSPEKVAEEIRKKYPNADFVFVVTAEGQFDVSWSVYIRLNRIHLKGQK